MNELAIDFESHRAHLRGVAFRMLGSLSEADDAVQEAWLRLSRADRGDVANLGGWLTTVVARVCLDMLRARKARREDAGAPVADVPAASDPEQETVLAELVGVALLVVLDTLDPAERLAFVLHDLFAVPFDDIAAIVGRSSDATRQLASRARRRVHGAPPPGDRGAQREVVEKFLAALRARDVEAIVAVLDPDVVFRAPDGSEIRGARAWATGAVRFARGAPLLRVALVDGTPGLVMAPRGKLHSVLAFEVAGGVIVRAEAIADPARLAALEIAILD